MLSPVLRVVIDIGVIVPFSVDAAVLLVREVLVMIVPLHDFPLIVMLGIFVRAVALAIPGVGVHFIGVNVILCDCFFIGVALLLELLLVVA